MIIGSCKIGLQFDILWVKISFFIKVIMNV